MPRLNGTESAESGITARVVSPTANEDEMATVSYRVRLNLNTLIKKIIG